MSHFKTTNLSSITDIPKVFQLFDDDVITIPNCGDLSEFNTPKDLTDLNTLDSILNELIVEIVSARKFIYAKRIEIKTKERISKSCFK